MYTCTMKPYEGDEKYIFVSYSHKDEDDVLPILDELAQKGYRIWYDEGIRSGSIWAQVVAEHLRNSTLVIAFFSPDYVKSDNCIQEISYTLELKKRYLEIDLYRTVKPEGLEMRLCVQKYVSKADYNEHERFLSAICAAPGMEECGPQQADISQAEPENDASALLAQGKSALAACEWELAQKCFENALDMQSDCAEAYLGEAMARDQVSSPDELFSSLEQKYSVLETEEEEACPEDIRRIENAVAEYQVDGYFEAAAIREIYAYDRNYAAQLPCRRRQRDRQLKELKRDWLIRFARQYATGDLLKQLTQKEAELASVLDRRVLEAEKADLENKKQVEECYAAFLIEADGKAALMSKAGLAKRKDAIAAAERRAKLQHELLSVKAECEALETRIHSLSDQLKETQCRYNTVFQERMKDVPLPGTIIHFGRYKQNNGTEEIPWLVLERHDDGKVLLISASVLDSRPFNTEKVHITWPRCTLRQWLNGVFCQAAFNTMEREQVLDTAIEDVKAVEPPMESGIGITDKVFLLSISEAEKYFSSDEGRQCRPTAYAKAQGAYENEKGAAWWWLRSSGSFDDYAAYVRTGGAVFTGGFDVDAPNGGIRPAIWVQF